MQWFVFEVVETRRQTKQVRVFSRDLTEARSRAISGVATHEDEVGTEGIVSREILCRDLSEEEFLNEED